MIKLIFVEQQGLFRASMKHLITCYPEFHLLGSFETGKELLSTLDKPLEVTIILSANIQDMSLVFLIKKLKRDSSRVKIVVLANEPNMILARQYILAGADGYIVKSITENEFIETLFKIQQNKTVLPDSLAQQLANQEITEENLSPFEVLSQREMDILLLMVKGKSIKAISEILHLSPKTISTYKGRIFEKLNVKSMMDVFLLAAEFGLIGTETTTYQ